MGLVIDTSAAIQLERGKLDLGVGGETFMSEPGALPVIVWAELLVGVRLATSPKSAALRLARLEQLKHRLTLTFFTENMAEHYADIYAELRKAGKTIPQNDTIVAATARALGYGVLVGGQDEAHFRQVMDLRVETLHG